MVYFLQNYVRIISLSCEEAAALMSLFTKPEDQSQVVIKLYPRLNDKANFENVLAPLDIRVQQDIIARVQHNTFRQVTGSNTPPTYTHHSRGGRGRGRGSFRGGRGGPEPSVIVAHPPQPYHHPSQAPSAPPAYYPTVNSYTTKPVSSVSNPYPTVVSSVQHSAPTSQPTYGYPQTHSQSLPNQPYTYASPNYNSNYQVPYPSFQASSQGSPSQLPPYNPYAPPPSSQPPTYPYPQGPAQVQGGVGQPTVFPVLGQSPHDAHQQMNGSQVNPQMNPQQAGYPPQVMTQSQLSPSAGYPLQAMNPSQNPPRALPTTPQQNPQDSPQQVNPPTHAPQQADPQLQNTVPKPTAPTADDGIDDDSTCVICLENPLNTLILECGHLCLCSECATAQIKTCPMCRRPVTRFVKVYKA